MAAPTSILRVFALAALTLGSLACRPEIGDPCKRAQDCGIYVIRQCDVSNVPRDKKSQGECILENCSFGTCPKEAECVKVYGTELLSVSCEPASEDIEQTRCNDGLVCDADRICRPDETAPNDAGEEADTGETDTGDDCLPGSLDCPCDFVDDCLPHEVCLPEGLCADEVRARTSCRRRCNKDNDCRSNYECAPTGAGGLYLAPDPTNPSKQLTESICVPAPEL